MTTSSCQLLVAVAICASSFHVAAETKSEIDAAKAALDLKVYQSTLNALIAQREAEARKATAEAERAELLTRLPPASSKALTGEIDVSKLGAAGLVKAFDLARELAPEVCSALPAGTRTVIHDPQSTQGVVAARVVNDSIAHMNRSLEQQAKELQDVIDKHTRAGTKVVRLSAVGLAAVPAWVKAVADMTALFKTDVTAHGIAYGDGARALFTTALVQSCPDKITGLGSGYFGELDPARYEQLVSRVRSLVLLRGQNAHRIGVIERLADASKGDVRKELGRVADSAEELLDAVDDFVESLKVGEASEKSPLYNAARYLGYAEQVRNALVLDFDLRLEGLTIVKNNLFTGQHLRLSGVAFLWYRVHEADGRLRTANAVRRISPPVRVDLRGTEAGTDFWMGR